MHDPDEAGLQVLLARGPGDSESSVTWLTIDQFKRARGNTSYSANCRSGLYTSHPPFLWTTTEDSIMKRKNQRRRPTLSADHRVLARVAQRARGFAEEARKKSQLAKSLWKEAREAFREAKRAAKRARRAAKSAQSSFKRAMKKNRAAATVTQRRQRRKG